MYTAEVSIRVRYAETDRMGYVYYGNYAQYYEVGRVEALRGLGFSYKRLEDDGIMLPVIESTSKFFKPAYYDNLLIIKTSIVELPKLRLKFFYEVFKASGEKIHEGTTTLVFVSAESRTPCLAPKILLDKLSAYF